MFINLIISKNRDKKLNITKNAILRYKNKTTAADLARSLSPKQKAVRLSGGVKLK
jgi:hypothetical protein